MISMMLFPGLHLNSHSQYLKYGINLIMSCGSFHPGIFLCMVRLNRGSVYVLLLILFNIRHDEARVKKHEDSYCTLGFDEKLNWVLSLHLFFFSLPCKCCVGSLHTYQHMHFSFSSPRHIAEGGLGPQ